MESLGFLPSWKKAPATNQGAAGCTNVVEYNPLLNLIPRGISRAGAT
jgi:hypothetical protein